jgi:hypothetical protein
MPVRTGPQPMRELYVYYQLAPEHSERLMAWLEGLQHELQQGHEGLSVKLLRRADEPRSAFITWMEIYTHPAGISATLQNEIESRAAAHPLFQAGCTRHVEIFEVCRFSSEPRHAGKPP